MPTAGEVFIQNSVFIFRFGRWVKTQLRKPQAVINTGRWLPFFKRDDNDLVLGPAVSVESPINPTILRVDYFSLILGKRGLRN
jgi:hypothetical protein